jgi:hypothetical protein
MTAIRSTLRLTAAALLAAACAGCLSITDTGPSVVLFDARTEPDTAEMQQRGRVVEGRPAVISARN